MFKQNQIDDLKKIQQQKNQIDYELSLQEIQSQIIKDYKMNQGQYKVIITIYQLNDLQPKSLNIANFQIDQKTACDSFVQVQIANQIKKTQIKKQTNNPIFDEQIFFKFDKLSVQQLDRMKILFNVYDTKLWGLAPSLIGCFELDWTSIYFKRNHQIYRGWLTLYDPNHELQGPVGYLLVNVAILGQKDQITVHDSSFIKDPLVTIEDTITSPKLPLINFSISIQIYRAEGLIPLDSMTGQVKAYVIAKFSGNKIKSSNIKSLNPEWNECLKIGAHIPNKSKYVTLQVRNKNNFSEDDLIGIIKIPFVDICKEDSDKPMWGHLYGPPLSGKDINPFNYATKMQIYGDKIGSHYRGRLFFKITGKKDVYTKNIKNKLFFKFPYRIAPVIPIKLYVLRIDLIEGFGFPFIQQCYLHFCLGQFTLKSKGYKMQKDLCYFFQMLQQKRINLSQDINSIPDLIIYFCNGKNQANRIGYCRIKAKQIYSQNNQNDSARTYQLRIDKSLNIVQKNGSCGFISAKISLFSPQSSPPPRKPLPKNMKHVDEQLILKVFLYRGQNIFPTNQIAICKPKIKFNFNGHQFWTHSTKQTYNPIWEQVYEIQIKSQDLFKVDLEKFLICDIYNQGNQKNIIAEIKDYIGSFFVKINGTMKTKLKLQNNTKIDMIYSKPKWYHIINQNIEIGNNNFGKILISCAIFHKNDIKNKRLQTQNIFNTIQTKCQQINFNFYVLGIRQMKIQHIQNLTQYLKNKMKSIIQKDIKIIPKIHINSQKKQLQIQGHQQNNIKQYVLKNSSIQMNRMYKFNNIKLPKNKKLTTFLDIKIVNKKNNLIYGFNSIDLRTLIPKKQELNQDQNTKNQQILNVQQLEKKLHKLKLLNKINQQIQEKNIQSKFISAKAIQIRNNQLINIIPPQQLQNNSIKLNDIELQMQMDRMLKYISNQIDKQFQSGNNQQINQINSTISSSSYYNHNHNQKYHFKVSQLKKQKKIQEIIYQMNDQHLDEEQQEKLIKKSAKNQKKYQYLTNQRMKNTLSKDLRNQQDNISINLSQNIIKNNSLKLNKFNNKNKKAKKSKRNDQISNFDIDSSAALSDNIYSQKAIKYQNVKQGLDLADQHQEQAIRKQQEYKYAAAVKLSLFKWMRNQKQIQKQTYLDYDTDQQENLDVIPEWYKGRKILLKDLENYLQNSRTIKNIPIYSGIKSQYLQNRVKQKIGTFKMVVVPKKDNVQIQTIQSYYQKLLKPKQFLCRVYALKGKSLLTNSQTKPTTYLRFIYGKKVTNYKQKSVKNQINPEYYMCHQQLITLPGPSTIRVEVMQTAYLIGQIVDNLKKDILLGYTQIDIQDRYFIKKWHLLDKKPIQLRNLYSQNGLGTQGRIQTWIDLVQRKHQMISPVIKITPPPWDEYQLRIIVWGAKDCVYKNQQMKSNDVFVRGQLGKSNYQQTDVHWACRALSSFNYRFKFPIFYPPKPQDVYSDIFIVQIWDKDVIGYNNLIGQTRINLNKMHKIIQKAVKRKKPVTAMKKIIEKNLIITDKFWFDVYNHKQKDQFGQLQSQGKVQLSFELVPMEMAKGQRANGFGRSQPNVYPTLPEPKGRLDFNILAPLDFVKQILGPDLYKSICAKFLFIFVLIMLIALFLLFGTSIVAGLVARS